MPLYAAGPAGDSHDGSLGGAARDHQLGVAVGVASRQSVWVAEGIDELVDSYLAVLLEMHENRVGQGTNPKRWNRLVDEMQAIQLRVRETEPGRVAISRLCGHDNATVRAWSATNALAWDPVSARRVLEGLAEEPGLLGFEAAVTLREFDAGRLQTYWEPRS